MCAVWKTNKVRDELKRRLLSRRVVHSLTYMLYLLYEAEQGSRACAQRSYRDDSKVLFLDRDAEACSAFLRSTHDGLTQEI
jgi:hypothetical protein